MTISAPVRWEESVVAASTMSPNDETTFCCLVRPHKRVAAEVGQRPPDLLLEQDDDRERQHDEEVFEDGLERRQVGELRQVVEQADEDDAQQHLHGAGAADEQQQVVDHHRDEQDVERVAPGDEVEEALRSSSAPRGPPRRRGTGRSRPRRGPGGWRPSPAAPGSGDQPAAARLAPSRRSGGGIGLPLRSTVLPRKLLRLAPRRIGRPSAASSPSRATRARFCSAGLAEADAGIEDDLRLVDAGGGGGGQGGGQLGADLADDVVEVDAGLHRGDLAAAVHEDDGTAGRRRQRAPGAGRRAR